MASSSSSSSAQFEEKIGKEDGHLDITLWLAYIRFLVTVVVPQAAKKETNETTTTPNKEVVIIFERALRIFPTSFKLWNWYLDYRCHHHNNNNNNNNSTSASSVTNISRLFERAVSSLSLPTSASPNDNNNNSTPAPPLLSIFTKWIDFHNNNTNRQQQKSNNNSSATTTDVVVIINIIQLAQKLLHPQALAQFLRHCLVTLSSSSSSNIPIVVEILSWISENNFGGGTSSFKLNNNVIYRTVYTVIEEIISSSSNDDDDSNNNSILAVLGGLECIDRITFRLSGGGSQQQQSTSNNDKDTSNPEEERQIQITNSFPRLFSTNRSFQTFTLELVDVLRQGLDSGFKSSSSSSTTTTMIKSVCQKFTDLIWMLQQQMMMQSDNDNNNHQDQEQQFNYCSCVISVVSCLCRTGNSDLIKLAKSILKTGLQNAANDDQVQTLYVSMLALNRELSFSSASNDISKKQNQDDDDANNNDDISFYTDLSPEALQREIVTWRTMRDPSDPSNWMELISLSLSHDDNNSNSNSSNENTTTKNEDAAQQQQQQQQQQLVDDQLFQKAIQACTSEAALMRNNTNNKTSSSSTTRTRPVHLFLSYAAWLEQKSSNINCNNNNNNIPAQLLKRAAASTYIDSMTGRTIHTIYSFHDRLILLQAGAEAILRSSSSSFNSSFNSSNNNNNNNNAMKNCVQYLNEICEELSTSSSSIPSSALATFSPLWSMRVELLLAMGEIDEALTVCWSGLKQGTVTTKLVLVVIDNLIARGIEIAENKILNGSDGRGNDNTTTDGNNDYNLASQSQNFIYSLQEFSRRQSEGFLKINNNKTISLPPLSSETIDLFEKASQLTHFTLDLFIQQQQQSSSSSSDSSWSSSTSTTDSLLTLYAVAFHLSLHLFNSSSSNTSTNSSGSISIQNLDMVRQLHKSTMSTITSKNNTTEIDNNNSNNNNTPLTSSSSAVFRVLLSRMCFAIGFVEWETGLNQNALEAFRQFCIYEWSVVNNSNTKNTSSSSSRNEELIARAEDSAFSFVVRRHAMVLLSSSSNIVDDNNNNSGGGSSSSNSIKLGHFINFVESLMQRASDVKKLLKFGMQMIMYLIVVNPTTTTQNNNSNNNNTNNSKKQGQQQQQQQSVAMLCLRSLAEIEDPRLDESGVWKVWQDFVVQSNDEDGYLDYTRFRRNMISKREDEDTTVVDM